GVRQDAGLVPPAGKLFAPPQQECFADAELASHLGQHGHVHHRRPELGQLALRPIGQRTERQVGHHKSEHGVPQELESLVGDERALLERERSVRERGFPELRVVEPHAESPLQRDELSWHERLLRSRPTRRRWPGGPRSTRSSRTRDAAASAGGTGGTPRTWAAWPSSERRASGSSTSLSSSSASASWYLLSAAGATRVPRLGARAPFPSRHRRSSAPAEPTSGCRSPEDRRTPRGCGLPRTARTGPGNRCGGDRN